MGRNPRNPEASDVSCQVSGAVKAPRAFTLIELLVSLGIVTVITGMMLANFRSGSQASELRFAADILVSQYRESQTSAIVGRLASICGNLPPEHPDSLKTCGAVACADPGICQLRVAPGYGLHLGTDDAENMTLYFDGNDNGLYDDGEERTVQPLVSTGNVLFDSSTAGSSLDVVFSPPSAAMGVNGLASPPDTVVITLRHRSTDAVRHVNLYRISGKIEHD